MSWYPETGFRFGSGLFGGAQLYPYTDFLNGEIGWSYHLRPRSHVLHLGVIGEVMAPSGPLLNLQLPLGFDLPLSGRERWPYFTASIGGRAPGTYAAPTNHVCLFD